MPVNVFPFNGMSVEAARSFWSEQAWFAQQEISLSNQQRQGLLEYADDYEDHDDMANKVDLAQLLFAKACQAQSMLNEVGQIG